jgi:SAM-dependent methyltransferase
MKLGTTYEEQRRYWQSVGKRRDPSHPAVVAFASPKVGFVRRTVDAEARTLLEVGAGNGYLSVPLADVFDVTCLDFSENMLAQNPLSDERKVQGRAEALPFGDASFDVVLCANLLHHLENPEQAVREMARVARRHVVLLEPNARNPLMFLFGLLKKGERGTVSFHERYLVDIGERSGLALRKATTRGFIVPNMTPLALVPWLERIDREHPLALCSVAVFDRTPR